MNKYAANIHFTVFETNWTWEIRMVVEQQRNPYAMKQNLGFTNNVFPNHNELK